MNRVTAHLTTLLTLCAIGAAQTPDSDWNPSAPSESQSVYWPVYLASAGFPGLFQLEAEKPAGEASTPVAPAAPPEGKTESGTGQPAADKRVFGVLPNYRTADGTVPFQPITTKQKFTIATKDSFDYPVLGTTALFTGLSQLEGSDNRTYGQGVKGFAERYGISYVDQVVGNFFPEAIAPTLFHMDPRYFRKVYGSKKSRFLYAADHIFISKNDKGVTTFNYSEIVGNAMASVTTFAYHPHERTLGDFVYQWGFTYIMADMIGQELKEFWPDVKRHFQKKDPALATQ
jgi:hypothetical protein